MSFPSRFRAALVVAIAAVLTFGIAQTIAAQDDVFHMVKGVVKSIDKDSKTMVVKAGDGTEHTIKWTEKTTVAGGKDVGDTFAEGSKVAVKYTEKAGEKTAVGVKDIGKATAKAVQ
jgi:Cu/Ag efflux protein CusF